MDRRVEKTRMAIQEAYLALLMEKKTAKITISEVARRANIDRKTFYLHYDSMEDVLKAFCRSLIDRLVEQARQAELSLETFSIQVLFVALNRMVKENMEFFRFISLNREYDFFFDEIKEVMVDELLHSYSGFFSFSETELKLYAEFFLSGIICAYVRWIQEGQPVPMEYLAELVQHAAYSGLKEVLPKGVTIESDGRNGS